MKEEQKMTDFQEYRKIYRAILDAVENSQKNRREIIDRVISGYKLSEAELQDNSTNARKNILRSRIGAVINEMHARGIIERNSAGIYMPNEEKPIAIRIEICEEKLLELLLSENKLTKNQIKERLVETFKTDTTATQTDDNQLFTYIGKILKYLVAEKIIKTDGSFYSIDEGLKAEVTDRKKVLALSGEFLRLIHSKGGEFFERYFMNLLTKYLAMSGKLIKSSYVTGGSDDGGIDGICETVDSLGFRETIMVQTKNRNIPASEVELRGFYGAVCARQGSRGIFATTSAFHPVATEFLEQIDNCVGIDGKRIFEMATETGYGIKIVEDRLVIDTDIFD